MLMWFEHISISESLTMKEELHIFKITDIILEQGTYGIASRFLVNKLHPITHFFKSCLSLNFIHIQFHLISHSAGRTLTNKITSFRKIGQKRNEQGLG